MNMKTTIFTKILSSAVMALAVLTASSCMKQSPYRYYGNPPEDVIVVQEGINPVADIVIIDDSYKGNRQQFLSDCQRVIDALETAQHFDRAVPRIRFTAVWFNEENRYNKQCIYDENDKSLIHHIVGFNYNKAQLDAKAALQKTPLVTLIINPQDDSYAYGATVGNCSLFNLKANEAVFNETVIHEVVGHAIAFLDDEYKFTGFDGNAYNVSTFRNFPAELLNFHKNGEFLNLWEASDIDNAHWAWLLDEPQYASLRNVEVSNNTTSSPIMACGEKCILRACKITEFCAACRLVVYERTASLLGETPTRKGFLEADKPYLQSN